MVAACRFVPHLPGATATCIPCIPTKVLWRWGVVTSYLLDLDEVDSIGAYGNDIMELVTDVRARRGARIMLLDDFMQGFLHSLFEQKWRAFGRYMYAPMLSTSCTMPAQCLDLMHNARYWGMRLPCCVLTGPPWQWTSSLLTCSGRMGADSPGSGLRFALETSR